MQSNHSIMRSVVSSFLVIIFVFLLSSSVGIAVLINGDQLVSSPSNADIVYVDDDYNQNTPGWGVDHFNNIQDGITAVVENGTVYVYNGTYGGKVSITKSLRLLGENAQETVFLGIYNMSDGIFRIDANYVNITGFTITYEYTNAFITELYINASYCTISNNIIRPRLDSLTDKNIHGIQVHGSYNNIVNNTIEYFFSPLACYGIGLNQASNNTLSGNYISSNFYGLCIYGSSHNTITRNIFSNIKRNYVITDMSRNTWDQNFWGRPRFLPKPIFGTTEIGGHSLPWLVDVDWHPAKTSNIVV